MADADQDRPGESGLNEKLLDAFVYVPAGLALSVVEELPGWPLGAGSVWACGSPQPVPSASSR